MDLFYEILQISLGTRTALTSMPTTQEWEEIYREADRQCLMGVIFTGVEKVVKNAGGVTNTTISPDFFASWYSCINKIEEKNHEINKKCAWLQQWLSRGGFSSCILKGQGNAMLYPYPLRRNPGDIDIWMWMKKFDDRQPGTYYGSQNRYEIIRWVQKKMDGKYAEVAYHHIQMEPLDGTEVEAHYWPTNVFNYFHERHFEHWCEDEHLRQMNNWKDMPDGDGRISVPTTDFNLLFQLIHIMRHFFHDGIGLRHIVDYYWLLQSKDIDYTDFDRKLTRYGLKSVLSGVLWILKVKLSMDISNVPFSANEKVGKVMLKEIERGGNLGHDDTGIVKWRNNNKLYLFFWRLSRNIRFYRICPMEVLWAAPFRLYQWMWKRPLEVKSEK